MIRALAKSVDDLILFANAMHHNQLNRSNNCSGEQIGKINNHQIFCIFINTQKKHILAIMFLPSTPPSNWIHSAISNCSLSYILRPSHNASRGTAKNKLTTVRFSKECVSTSMSRVMNSECVAKGGRSS